MVCMNSRWLHFASAFRFATCACSFCDTHSSLAFLCVSVRSRAIWTLTSSQLPPFNISSLGRCRVLLLCTLSICPFFADCFDPSLSLPLCSLSHFPAIPCRSFILRHSGADVLSLLSSSGIAPPPKSAHQQVQHCTCTALICTTTTITTTSDILAAASQLHRSRAQLLPLT